MVRAEIVRQKGLMRWGKIAAGVGTAWDGNLGPWSWSLASPVGAWTLDWPEAAWIEFGWPTKVPPDTLRSATNGCSSATFVTSIVMRASDLVSQQKRLAPQIRKLLTSTTPYEKQAPFLFHSLQTNQGASDSDTT
eukprot:gene13005-3504_t